MSETWLQIYIVNLLGLPLSQLSTIVLSVQPNVYFRLICNTFLTLWPNIWANSCAPLSSNLGMVSCLIGATLILDVTRATWILPWVWYRQHQCKHAWMHLKTMQLNWLDVTFLVEVITKNMYSRQQVNSSLHYNQNSSTCEGTFLSQSILSCHNCWNSILALIMAGVNQTRTSKVLATEII